MLDLRCNGGGDAEAMADVASLFLDDGIKLGRFADRSGASFELQTYSKRLWRVPQLSRIKLPLVVLTSESTSSAAEIMVAAVTKQRTRSRDRRRHVRLCARDQKQTRACRTAALLDVSEFDYRTAERCSPRGPRHHTRRNNHPPRATIIYSRRDPAARTSAKP